MENKAGTDLAAHPLDPPVGWVDTPEQAQLRACLRGILDGKNDVAMIAIGKAVVALMRDQLMTGTATLRRSAALSAREHMAPAQIAVESGETIQTISRLLTEARTEARNM